MWQNNLQGFVSFESISQPGNYIRHNGSRLKVAEDDGSEFFQHDVSFDLVAHATGTYLITH